MKGSNNGNEAAAASARAAMNIISNNTSAQMPASMNNSASNINEAAANADFNFSSNFKILNISTATTRFGADQQQLTAHKQSSAGGDQHQ